MPEIPPSEVSIRLDDTVVETDLDVVHQGLREYNAEFVNLPQGRSFLVTARDSTSQIIGGLEAELWWRWLHVKVLWVAAPSRRSGVGSRLLAEAERFAVRQDCDGSYLDTFDFQALEFYEGHGYSVFGVHDGFPPGHKHFYLQKNFSENPRGAI